MKKILIIDTSDSKKTTVKLDNIEVSETIKSENILSLIDKLLKKCHTNLNELSGIQVNEGPGSYTGLRVGISVANALSIILNIPVNGKKQVFPNYQ